MNKLQVERKNIIKILKESHSGSRYYSRWGAANGVFGQVLLRDLRVWKAYRVNFYESVFLLPCSYLTSYFIQI